MTDADELAKLAAMHAAGSLTGDEFTAAKARLLSDSASGDSPAAEPSHRGRWVAIAAVAVLLLGLGATAAVVASSSDSTSTAEDTQPTAGPTTSHGPLILAPSTTRVEVTPTTVDRRQAAMDAFATIQRTNQQLVSTLEAPYNAKTMTAEDFVSYCSLLSEPYAAWAVSLRNVRWPPDASAQVGKLADDYNILSGLYSECSTTDPASPRLQDLSRANRQLAGELLVAELDAASAVGWTACADGPPPCFP